MSDADSVDGGWGATAPATPAGNPLWQVNTRGRKVVEMTLEELVRTYKSGKLTGRSLVWSEGMREWAPIGDVAKLTRLLRDSEPPASGARLIGDEAEASVAATKSYTSSGSEPPTDPGTLAIYERPLAMIEFPEVIEPVPESVDEPTPAFGARTSIRATLPGIAPEDWTPISASEIEPAPPPVPPLPPRPQASFPAPVSASPLGAALSSMVAPGSQPRAASKPPSAPSPGASYAVAKATSVPSTAALKLSTPLPGTMPLKPAANLSAAGSATSTPLSSPSNSKPIAATAMPNPDTASSAPKPASTSSPPKPSSSTAAPKPAGPSSAPMGSEQKLPHDVVPAPPPLPASKAPLVTPPRPAIEFLPPIIVQEKEDDGASIIRMPLEPPAPVPLDAEFHESTLVLAGRRRPKRWVSLGAAVAAVMGGACLASAVTALLVRTRPEAPRVVEKRVVVTVPATAAPVVAPPQNAAPARTVAAVQAPPNANVEHANVTNVANERAAAKTETAKSDASKPEGAPAKAWHKDDPGALEATTAPHRELRAGFPTNPGF